MLGLHALYKGDVGRGQRKREALVEINDRCRVGAVDNGTNAVFVLISYAEVVGDSGEADGEVALSESGMLVICECGGLKEGGDAV